jgi:hypothetical protein
MELGKDLVATREPRRVGEPRVWAFQLKVGNLTQSDFADLRTQLEVLTAAKIRKPNIDPDEAFQPVLVTTGQLHPTVETLVRDLSEREERAGRRAVEVWAKPQLLNFFETHIFNVDFQRGEAGLLLINILPLVAEGLTTPNDVEALARAIRQSDDTRCFARLCLAATIIRHQALSHGRQFDWLDVGARLFCHAWAVGAGRIPGFSTRWRAYLSEYFEDLCASTKPLTQAVLDGASLFVEGEMSEIISFPLRVWDAIEKLGLLVAAQGCGGQFNESDAQIASRALTRLIVQEPAASRLLWDGLAPSILLGGSGLAASEGREALREWLQRLLEDLAHRVATANSIPEAHTDLPTVARFWLASGGGVERVAVARQYVVLSAIDLLCKEYELTLDWRSVREPLHASVRLLHICVDHAAAVDPTSRVERIWKGAFSWAPADYPSLLHSIPTPAPSGLMLDVNGRWAGLLSLITNRKRLMMLPLQKVESRQKP